MQDQHAQATDVSTGSSSRQSPPRSVLVVSWIWVVGSVISVLGIAVATVIAPGPVMLAGLVLSVVQAAVAIPSAILFYRGGRTWSRFVLLVLAAFSIGSLWQSIDMGAWPSLVLNLALGGTIGVMVTPETKQHCRPAPAVPAPAE